MAASRNIQAHTQRGEHVGVGARKIERGVGAAARRARMLHTQPQHYRQVLAKLAVPFGKRGMNLFVVTEIVDLSVQILVIVYAAVGVIVAGAHGVSSAYGAAIGRSYVESVHVCACFLAAQLIVIKIVGVDARFHGRPVGTHVQIAAKSIGFECIERCHAYGRRCPGSASVDAHAAFCRVSVRPGG